MAFNPDYNERDRLYAAVQARRARGLEPFPQDDERERLYQAYRSQVPITDFRDSYAAEQDARETGVSFSDYAKSLMAGIMDMGNIGAKGISWLARRVGVSDFGDYIDNLGTEAVAYFNDSLSDAAKEEVSKQFVRRDPNQEFQWTDPFEGLERGDAGLQTALLQATRSIPSTAASWFAGGALFKGAQAVLKVFGNPFGRAVLQKTAAPLANAAWVESASQQALKTATNAASKLRMIDRVIGIGAFGAGEGLISGASEGISVYERVLQLPHEKLLENARYLQIYNSTDGMDEAERRKYASESIAREAATEAGWQSGLTTALLGAPMGAFWGPILGRTGILATTLPRAAGIGIAGEAAQEFLQSGSEAAIGASKLKDLGADVDVFGEAINQAVAGAIAGGLMGGVFGAVTFNREGKAANPEQRGSPQQALMNAALEARNYGVPREDIEAIINSGGTPVARIKRLRDRMAAQKMQPDMPAQAPPTQPMPTPREKFEPFRPPPREPPAGGAPTARAAHAPAAPEQIQPGVPLTIPEPGAPAEIDIRSDVDIAAHAAAASPLSAGQAPTPAQDQAENYRLGRVNGADIGMPSMKPAVEYPQGSERNGITMTGHYGRFVGTRGGDAQPLDFILGKDLASDRVYLYHHYDELDRFEQHKIVAAVSSREEAEQHLDHFYRGKAPGDIVEMSRQEFEQWSARGDTMVPHPQAPKREPQLTRVEGKTDRIFTPAGKAIDVRYELREADEDIVSHLPSGEINPRAKRGLQPRDRGRAGMRQWITETSDQFEPALVVEGASTNEGPSMITPEGEVIGGHGRSLLINEMYRRGDTRYQDYLLTNAERFGLKPEDVRKLKKPKLDRVVLTPMTFDELRAFAGETNEAMTAEYSPSELARIDADALTDEVLAKFSPSEGGNVVAPSNSDFIAAFIGRLPAAGRTGLQTATGEATPKLASRIQAAVFSKAYADDRLTKIATEEVDPDLRNVISALVRAAPAFARARAAGADVDMVVKPLIAAYEIVRNNKLTKQPLSENLFSPGIGRMSRFIDTNMRSSKRMAEGLAALGEFLEQSATKTQNADMFGAPQAPDLTTAFEMANQRMREATGDEPVPLFSRQGVKPGAVVRLPSSAAPSIEIYAVDAVAKQGAEASPGLHLIAQGYDGAEETLRIPDTAEAIQAMVDAVLEIRSQAEQAGFPPVELAALNTLHARLISAVQGLQAEPDLYTDTTGVGGAGDQGTLFERGFVTYTGNLQTSYPDAGMPRQQLEMFLPAARAEQIGRAPPEQPPPAYPAAPDETMAAPPPPATGPLRLTSHSAVRTGYYRSTVDNVIAAQDAAHVLAPLRRGAQESLVALVMDKEGKPLAVLRHGIGTIDGMTVYNTPLLGMIHNVPDAAAVWFAHNHPSGVTEQSDADLNITKKLQDLMRGTGIETMGMITVSPGSTKASVFFLPNAVRDTLVGITAGPRGASSATQVPFFGERRVQRASSEPALKKVKDARAIIKRMAKPKETGVLLLTTRHQPSSWVPISDAEMEKLRAGEVGVGASRLLQELDRANAPAMIARTDSYAAAANLANFASSHDIRLLDVIGFDGSSLAERGALPAGGSPFFARSGPPKFSGDLADFIPYIRGRILYDLDPGNYGGRRTAEAIAGNMGDPRAEQGVTVPVRDVQPVIDALELEGVIEKVRGAYQLRKEPSPSLFAPGEAETPTTRPVTHTGSWGETFRVSKRSKVGGGTKTSPSDRIIWEGMFNGRRFRIESTVRLADPSIYFMTISNARINFDPKHWPAHYVDLVVQEPGTGEFVSEDELYALVDMAQREDQRRVVIRRRHEAMTFQRAASTPADELTGPVVRYEGGVGDELDMPDGRYRIVKRIDMTSESGGGVVTPEMHGWQIVRLLPSGELPAGRADILRAMRNITDEEFARSAKPVQRPPEPEPGPPSPRDQIALFARSGGRISDIQDFGDLVLAEQVDVDGEEVEISQPAQRAFEHARDRVKILESLRECLGR